MGVSDVCRFQAAERAVWSSGHAGTVASRAGCWAPELTLARKSGDGFVVGAYALIVRRMTMLLPQR
eukprot:15450621-Alexandrium_andersonii.AAC.1